MGRTVQSARQSEKKKKKLRVVVKHLNAAGYTGGFYHYKKKECSCCYGLKDTFNQVNGNKPENWDSMGFKFTYDQSNSEKATEFRLLLNKLVEDDPSATPAKANNCAVIIKLTD
jgi:hypothetical protein